MGAVCRLVGRWAVIGTVAGLFAGAAHAQTLTLPTVDVTSSRLGGIAGLAGGIGIVGSSTTIITAQDIERSPVQTLPEILSREPGIQVRSLFGSVNSALTTVDMRGFGATGTSNTLVLINGRRLNDVDMASVDFSAIPLNSIERIEITRGNSAAVLYGDGAVGGAINIVTKTGVALPPSLRLEGQVGSYKYYAGSISANVSSGPFAASAFGNVINSDGYRENNELRQRNAVTDFRYTGDMGSVYLNLSADSQNLGLPGGRLVTLMTSQLETDRRGAATPFDYGKKNGVNVTAGVTRTVTQGTELIVDGGVRYKKQESAFFSTFGSDFDAALDTALTTYSVTPRIVSAHNLFGAPGKLIAGLDYYNSDYNSDRMLHSGDQPNHRYDLRQQTLAAYFQETLTVVPTTDIALGARVQNNAIHAQDRLDAAAPGGLFAAPEGLPHDRSEMQWAGHFGFEHRLTEIFAVFGRVAHAFRLPNVDERVAQGPFATPTTFDLRTQTSNDVEGGFRVRWRGFSWQTSAYRMMLKNEIFFSPATFTNTNLDPTRRQGVENIASYQLNEAVKLKGGLAYTRAEFREGPFAGKNVPLVARWTGMAGVSWDIWQRTLVFDAMARFVGKSRMDNDSANTQPMIPAHTVVDVRIGGKYNRVSWSLAVQNLFDDQYFEYAVASAFTLGTYNAYPLPGRTFLGRLAVDLL